MAAPRDKGRVDMIGGLANRVLMRVPLGVLKRRDDRGAQPFGQHEPMILAKYPPRCQRGRAGDCGAAPRDGQPLELREYR